MLRSPVLLFTVTVAMLIGSPGAQAIIGGQPDGNAHPYVGMVFQETGAGTGRFFVCSGSLISPSVVVTAGHCTHLFQNSVGAQPVRVSFAADASNYVGQVTGTPSTFPTFCIGCSQSLAGFDVGDAGVVVLDTPVVMARYATLPAAGAVDALPHNSTVLNVGYGFLQPPNPPAPRDRGIRYSAPATVLQSGSAPVQETFLKLSQNLAKGKGATCGGDSGGPVLPLNDDVVLAVHSFSPSADCTGVQYSFRIDQPAILAWIGGFLTTP